MQLKLHCVTIEDMVPADHFLRKLDAAVDFSFIYDVVRDLYSSFFGRPSIDPTMLVKYLLIGYLYGIESERRIEQEIQVNMAYRWFLGLDIGERVPDHSTISQNRRRRFKGENLFRHLFEHILGLCIEKGLVDGKLILTDSTHVKANASPKANVKIQAERETSSYLERLDRYETLERERLEEEGRISPQRKTAAKSVKANIVEKTVSTTDPEAGFLRRPGKPQGMHYLDHQSIDAKNGIIVDVAVTAGNVNDVTPYPERIEHMLGHIGLGIEAVGVDSAYDVSFVHQILSEHGIEMYTPKNHEEPRYKVEFTRKDFLYNESDDTFTCPDGKHLTLKRFQRSEYSRTREYLARLHDCGNCTLHGKCLAPSQTSRKININLFDSAFRRNHEKDGSPEHKRVLVLRQIWCEGTFAVQKAGHNLTRILRRGLEAAEDHCLLSATAVNLKRMIHCLG